MPYGTFKSASVAIGEFVSILMIDGTSEHQQVEVINIRRAYAEFLHDNGFERLRAAEEAERQLTLVKQRVNLAIEGWRALGVPAPVNFGDDDNLLITWKHPRHSELTGYDPLDAAYVEAHEWLGRLYEAVFLIPCACFLCAAGCDPVFVTEGTGDSGVDCIGRISAGPLHSVILFIQAKTHQSRYLGAEAIFQEYGKYAALPRTEKYTQYLNALGQNEIADGSCIVYIVASNREFSFEARRSAARLGVVLRSRRQLAYFLAKSVAVEEMRRLVQERALPVRSDLGFNIARKLRSVVRGVVR